MNMLKKHLFKDKEGRLLHYEYAQKRAYYIPEKLVGKYRLYSNRLLLSLTITVLLVTTILGIWESIFIGTIVEALLTYLFYQRFLPSLVKKEGVKLDSLKVFSFDTLQSENEKKNLLARSFACLGFGVLLILNAIDQNMLETNIVVFYISTITGLVSCGYSIYCVGLYLRK